jgi:hypothetical protein
MTSRDFCYWLQGFFELAGPGVELNAERAAMIGRHLNLVFKHEIDPSMGGSAEQKKLNEIHAKIGGVDPISGLVVRC